ncbi:MAG: SHD1 domain-containing protein, partial [Planctomycetota bacterium]
FGDPPAEDDAAPVDDLESLFGQPQDNSSDEQFSEEISDLFSAIEPTETLSDEAEMTIEAAAPQAAETIAVQVVAKRTPMVSDPLAQTHVRTWIDNTGTYRVNGRLVELGDGYVRLLKDNGRTCTVPRNRMCQADAAYVASIIEEMESVRLAMVAGN